MKLYGYSRCSTCVKAKKFLNNKNFDFEFIEILDNPIEKNELDKYIKLSGIDINKFFNTSGVVYKEMKLSTKIKTLDYSTKLELLSSNPKLVKRPILITENKVLVGFKEDEYENI